MQGQDDNGTTGWMEAKRHSDERVGEDLSGS